MIDKNLIENPSLDRWVWLLKRTVQGNNWRDLNGGFITDNGDLYRVFQTPGFNIYGKSMGIAKITELSDSNYQEELSFNITPDFFKNIKGTHTFSHDDGVLLFDFVKYESRKK